MSFPYLSCDPLDQVKVGGKEDVKKEAEDLRDLVKKAKQEGWKLRLDANRCWDLEQVKLRPFLSLLSFPFSHLYPPRYLQSLPSSSPARPFLFSCSPSSS